MPLIQLIVLALIQGITEFLPVSSSAHLILAPLAVKDWADQGPLIDVAAHVGSLGAVLAYFRSETATLFRGGVDTLRFRQSDDRRLFLMIAAATVPIVVIGGVFAATGFLDAVRSPVVIGWAFILFGLLLWHGDRQPAVKDDIKAMSWRDAMAIGACQVMAIIPGSSRSGVTMTAARYLGWTRTEAARFSMLIAIPTISASGLFAGISLASEGAQESMSAAAIVAVLSFFSALAAIAVFMRLTRSMSFTPFVIYRLVVGAVLLAFAGQLNGYG
ncbi:MAG: undecaprenyl-diphosphate phosphatase [Pseudomonadota bacterium]